MKIRHSLIIWLGIIIGVALIIPDVRNMMFSNLLVRKEYASRKPVDPLIEPFNAVGRLVSHHGLCTATLINPQIIITATHCVIKDNDFIDADKLQFQLERDGKFIPMANGKVLFANREFIDFGFNAIAKDFAFLYLDKPVDIQGNFPVLALLSPAKQTKVVQAGYGPDKHDRLFADDSCVMEDYSQNKYGKLARHNCLIVQGDSGGPVFMSKNNKWMLIGVNTALVGNNNVMHAYAIPTENYFNELTNFMAVNQKASNELSSD